MSGYGDDASPSPSEAETPRPPSRWERIWRHPVVRWGERIFWVAVGLFVLNRLGPQLSAWTGIGPVLGEAPAFEVVTLDGERIDGASLRGRVVVLNFWATWCTPCRIEIPALQAVHEDFTDDEVVVIGVSTDVSRADVVDYLEERGVTYPVGMADADIRRAFGGIAALPTTFVIDADGIVRHRVLGIFAPPAMRAAVTRAVEDARAARSRDTGDASAMRIPLPVGDPSTAGASDSPRSVERGTPGGDSG